MPATGLWLTVALALVACGPSSGEIKRARLSVYTAPRGQMFELALQAAQETYEIGETEPDKQRFATRPQWFQEDGRQGGTDEGNGEYVEARGDQVQVSLVVQVMDIKRGRVAIEITPKTFQRVAGSQEPRELTPEDPNLPPWVKGRVDALAIAIYNRGRYFATPP